MCFYCGVGLKDWEEMDDPWVEHAVWSPKCIHVVLIKGQAFIEECHRLKEARTQVEVGLIPFYGYTGMVLFNSCVVCAHCPSDFFPLWRTPCDSPCFRLTRH